MSSRVRMLVAVPAAVMTAAALSVTVPAAASPAGAGGSGMAAASDDGCYFHLYDGDGFDEDDDHFKLTEPGDYESLEDLPGADKDWNDEADSVKVGSDATVKIWKETGFEGESKELEPGEDYDGLDPEPSSLKMSCDDDGDDGDDDTADSTTELSQDSATTVFGFPDEATFTATIESDDEPVHEGDVDFTAEKTTALGGSETVTLCSDISVTNDGTATCTTSLQGLVGQYTVEAKYAGTDAYAGSESNSVTHYVLLPGFSG